MNTNLLGVSIPSRASASPAAAAHTQTVLTGISRERTERARKAPRVTARSADIPCWGLHAPLACQAALLPALPQPLGIEGPVSKVSGAPCVTTSAVAPPRNEVIEDHRALVAQNAKPRERYSLIALRLHGAPFPEL